MTKNPTCHPLQFVGVVLRSSSGPLQSAFHSPVTTTLVGTPIRKCLKSVCLNFESQVVYLKRPKNIVWLPNFGLPLYTQKHYDPNITHHNPSFHVIFHVLFHVFLDYWGNITQYPFKGTDHAGPQLAHPTFEKPKPEILMSNPKTLLQDPYTLTPKP